MGDLGKILSSLEEKLLDPFSAEGLEEEFRKLYEAFKRAKPEEIKAALGKYQKVKELLERNEAIIAGSLEPIIKRAQEGIFSRRV